MDSREVPLSTAAAPPPAARTPTSTPPEVVLRFLLFVFVLVAIVVMITSKQTVQGLPAAMFNNAPAFIYFVAALSVAGLYGVVTTLLSLYALLKPGRCSKLLPHFVIFDVILLGIVAAATGSALAIAYTGLKGNSHLNWGKICNVYGKFCRRTGISITFAMFASAVLVLLILLSFSSLSRKISK